ncbi:MAG: hypothetical protein IPL26_11445 [Leptospiraceae bacterium]|nr:hypothetical protein [Leptospiraceae bacterium]
MAYFLNKLDTSPELTTTSYSKRNPAKRIFISGIILFIIIAISIFILLNYDPSNPNAEKDLTLLHARYKKGEKLDKKEFALYCLLLEKVWKMHLLSCYCPDGVINPTKGIDWTNPPNSPEKLGSEWVEVTEPEKVKNTDSRIFMNRVSKERISFDRKTPGKDGFSGKDHWHRFNPLPIEGKNKMDYYLDECGKPVKKGSSKSHIEVKNLGNY